MTTGVTVHLNGGPKDDEIWVLVDLADFPLVRYQSLPAEGPTGELSFTLEKGRYKARRNSDGNVVRNELELGGIVEYDWMGLWKE